jgi:nucleoid-associated protein YgaU
MSSDPGKPDFSKVKGGFASIPDAAPDPAPAEPDRPDFSKVKGGFASADKVPDPTLMPVNTHTVTPTYTVAKGDTLSGISKQIYGKASLWRMIYEANRDVIKNPDLIQVGWVLKIPPAPTEA